MEISRAPGALLFVLFLAASAGAQTLVARRITDAADLPTGKVVLGKIGDYLLANDRIAVVIDDVGKRQGFAESGGNIVDAVRRDRNLDLFAQLITYFDNTFPRQALYDRVEIVSSGGAGAREARIRVSGRELNEASIRVTTEYSVRPGEYWVQVETTLLSTGTTTHKEFELGDAVQWGLTEHFAPSVGFNLGGRALANLEWLAGPGEGASYGYTVASGTFFGPHGSNWSDANVSRPDLTPNVPAAYTRYLIVGSGDIASVTDVVFALRKQPTGTLTGRVTEEGTGASIGDAVIDVQSVDATPVNQIKPRPDGMFRANLPPGDYVLVATGRGRGAPQPLPIKIAAGAAVSAPISLGRPGRLGFRFTTPDGKPLPVKVTLKGLGSTPDPYLGPSYQARGAVNVVFTHTGAAETLVPPGLYAVYASRGIEYTLFSTRLEIEAGKTASVAGTLERVVDTRGAVSGDFHLHSEYSADSNVAVRDKVIGLVAEGVELAVSSDHNFIADYRATIRELELDRELRSTAGDEVTVSGLVHFNVFPLEPHPNEPRGGAIDPAKMKVQEMIDATRKDPGDEVVQLNHPRAGNIGYFTTSKFDSAALRSPDPTFTLDFDAIEVFNGKRVTEAEEVLRDWFNLLNAGHRFTATGNSDSHKLVGEEAGYPRNFVFLGKDEPAAVSEEELVRAVKAHKIVVSNGPFFRVEANGKYGVGETFSSGGKPVTFSVALQSAPWIDVSEVSLFENGRVVARKLIGETSRADKGTHTFTLTPKADAWYVVVVRGDRGLAPVIPNLGEREVLPLAFSNPIWVDADGDGKFTAPNSKAAK